MQFAFLTAISLLAAFVHIGGRWPHYIAPGTCLFIVMMLQGVRFLRARQRHAFRGRFLVRALCVVCAISYALGLARHLTQARRSPLFWHDQRAQLASELEQQSGRHLVVVRYGPEHNDSQEWVWNRADIDGAKIVWAREMDEKRNRELVDYFRDREIWLLQADKRPVELMKFGTSVDHGSRGQ